VHAAEGPQRVDRAVSSPLSIISLGDVGGDGGVTDRATRGACSAGSGVVRCTTSLGLRSSYDASRHRLGFAWDRTTLGWARSTLLMTRLVYWLELGGSGGVPVCVPVRASLRPCRASECAVREVRLG